MISTFDRIRFVAALIICVLAVAAMPWPGADHFVHVVYAGNRACDPRQGAPCDQDNCNKMAKGQMYCSPVCHKDCCKCPTECNGHQHDPAPSPDPEGGSPDQPDAVLGRRLNYS